jgi:hypothetical protein
VGVRFDFCMAATSCLSESLLSETANIDLKHMLQMSGGASFDFCMAATSCLSENLLSETANIDLKHMLQMSGDTDTSYRFEVCASHVGG